MIILSCLSVKPKFLQQYLMLDFVIHQRVIHHINHPRHSYCNLELHNTLVTRVRLLGYVAIFPNRFQLTFKQDTLKNITKYFRGKSRPIRFFCVVNKCKSVNYNIHVNRELLVVKAYQFCRYWNINSVSTLLKPHCILD